ncbi:DNA-3-methyladenine glycosylase [Terriglobus saanensis]|uniref:Putative 3-methyladenine DNA glycosylase n=1 Tax=Terriglobus saanensis (strain ATCC BAA-1853 / DSM 23119 / SP1PR4) TaxID=401053 RepID=E8V173_TERSS|nr:DNA-3-methyladenine glycosylase [Terriglobus saanensis]ADV84488.1 DNA-3-methyladenine glycosylase [Terriglobus saanensis SP1PR4]
MTPSTHLQRTFYERHPSVVAPELLGKLVVRRYRRCPLVGRITEVEAYLGLEDQASHASRAKSAFNAVLFGPAGYTDVYLIYGLHHCLNISCHPAGQSGGVLIRALQPIVGVSTMAKLRKLPANAPSQRISGGPGRVCQALGITRANVHGLDVTSHSSAIQIVDDGWNPPGIRVTKRIGIRKSVDLPLRFLVADGEV